MSKPFRRYVMILSLLISLSVSLLLPSAYLNQAIAQPTEDPQTIENQQLMASQQTAMQQTESDQRIVQSEPPAVDQQPAPVSTTVSASASSTANQNPLDMQTTLLYPSEVVVSTKDNRHIITKIYDLPKDVAPSAIPKEDFEQEGYCYIFTDMTVVENYAEDTKVHQETLTFEAWTDQFDEVLAMTPKQKEVTTADGYSGTLELSVDSIKTQPAGYGTKSNRYTVTRTYPYLSAADTSYIPKTITEGGRTLNLTNVQWQTDNTATVDGYNLADRYTAVASYTGTSTSQYVKGYIVTAQYNGTVSKIINDTMHCEVIYAGSRIKPSINWQYPVTLLIILCLAALGYLLIRNKKIKENYYDEEENEENEEHAKYANANPKSKSSTRNHKENIAKGNNRKTEKAAYGEEALLANLDEEEPLDEAESLDETEQALLSAQEMAGEQQLAEEQANQSKAKNRRHVYGDDDDTIYPGLSQ